MPQSANPMIPKHGHHAAKAKRVIYLHMSGRAAASGPV
jgi:hypothetical protein